VAIVSQAALSIVDVSLGHGHSLSVIQSFDGSQYFNISLEQICQPDEQATAIRWGCLAPCALESGTSGLDGDVDILRCSFMHGCNDFLGGRIDGLKCLALEALNEFVINEPVQVRCRNARESEEHGLQGQRLFISDGWGRDCG
jgi:hypothetical protein